MSFKTQINKPFATTAITQSELKSQVLYMPETGEFYCVEVNHPLTYEQDGTSCLKLNDIVYTTSIMAWLYVTGELPDYIIGFKNGNRLNTRWSNLKLTEQPYKKTRKVTVILSDSDHRKLVHGNVTTDLMRDVRAMLDIAESQINNEDIYNNLLGAIITDVTTKLGNLTIDG